MNIEKACKHYTVQTDQGSNYMSCMFAQVAAELVIDYVHGCGLGLRLTLTLDYVHGCGSNRILLDFCQVMAQHTTWTCS